MTHPDHLPPEKVAGLTVNRDACRALAATIGPATDQIVVSLLDDPAVDRLRTANRLLALGKRFGDERLEMACDRALQFDEPAYVTVKHILAQGLDAQPAEIAPATPPARTFARTAVELVGHLFGGVPWN